MPRPHFKRLSPEQRNRLLGLALGELAERGLERASLNEILSRAGISKGAYYYSFKDKQDLFATAVATALDASVREVELPELEAVTAARFWSGFENALRHAVTRLGTNDELVRAMRALTPAERESSAFKRVLERSHLLWRRLVLQGQRVGAVRSDLDPELLVQLVDSVDRTLDRAFFARRRPGKRALEQHLALVFDTFHRLLAPAAKSGRGARPVSRRKR